ncbi:hypothetical protein H4R99_008393, partial [Coemansia sp. RSA 1722]
MPPVDITRLYAFGYEHVDLRVVTTIVEKVVEHRADGSNVHRTTSVVIREQGGALAPVSNGRRQKRPCHHKKRLHAGKHGYFGLGAGKHYRHGLGYSTHHRKRRYKSHHRHHRHHHKHSDSGSGADPAPPLSPGPDHLANSYVGYGGMSHVGHRYGHHKELPFTGFYNSAMAGRLADFALSELGFLVLSFVLSLVLLFVGYKVGECVCRFENSRDRSRGRGHKSSLARRYACRGTQTTSAAEAPPQPIYLEEDDVSNEMVCAAENGSP